MRVMPTPSPRAERLCLRRPARSCVGVAVALGLSQRLLLTPAAHAHDTAADPLPDSPGLRLGASALLSTLSADPQPLPAARYSGWLGSGQTPADRQGAGLEHATAELGLRFTSALGAALAWGKHGGDRSHVEAARLEWRQALTDLPRPLAGELRLSAGRDRVALGAPVAAAGHFDRVALVPLAKRLMLNDDWLDDGVNLQWRAAAGEAASGDATAPVSLQSVDLGLWRARKFPGARQGRAAPVLHLQGEAGELQAHVFAAALSPHGRGTPAASVTAGHTHDVPDCSRSLVGLVCFDGRSTLAGASLSWAPHGQPLQLQGSWLAQLERGQLYSANGDVAYRGLQQGGWGDVIVKLAPRWQTVLRAERVTSSHRLVGPGAGLVSQDAGLAPNHAVQRQTLALGWTPRRSLALRAEAGREQTGAGAAQRWVGLRLALSNDSLWSLSW
ncbi:MAG: hypothetical protein RLZZ584_137 [Pseudomonadota bacterium]